jgi:ribosome maturation factor RimP
MDLVERVKDLTIPLLATFGVELVEVQVAGAARRPTLRFTIDSERGVTVDDCARVSREIEDLLDSREVVPGGYVLEVSSPGLTRSLRIPGDLARYEGRLAKVTLKRSGSSGQVIVGRLGPLAGNTLEMVPSEGGEPVSVAVDDIAKARLEIDVASELKRSRGGRNR